MNFMVMAKVVFKSLLKGPATLMYPVKVREYPALFRGKIEIKIEDCILCGLCQRKCPTGAIKVSKENKTWEIDKLKCIICNSCVEACPQKCLFTDNHYSSSTFDKSVSTVNKPAAESTK